METCWFCERRPAAGDTAFTATVYGNLKAPPPSNGRPIVRGNDVARVAVLIARCSTCARLRRRESAITLAGLALGVIVLVGPYAVFLLTQHRAPFEIFGSATATAVGLTIVGFLGGLLAGVLVSARVNRGMARRDARMHPAVVELTEAGWSYDPPSVD
jgi:hypothetical protein